MGRLSRGGVAYARVVARSVVYWDRRQLAAVWVTGWWFGCAERQTEKLLVVTNKQVTAKRKNIVYLMWCFVVTLEYVLLNHVAARDCSALRITNTKIMKMWTGCDAVTTRRYSRVLQDR